MENKEQTFNLKQIIEKTINPELIINSDEFNNDYTTIIFLQKYIDRGLNLITGLVNNYIDGDYTVKPNRLTIKIDFDLENTTNEELINLMASGINEAIETKYYNEFSIDDLSYTTLYQFGNLNFLVDNKTLKEENKIRLIIEIYIDVNTELISLDVFSQALNKAFGIK